MINAPFLLFSDSLNRTKSLLEVGIVK